MVVRAYRVRFLPGIRLGLDVRLRISNQAAKKIMTPPTDSEVEAALAWAAARECGQEKILESALRASQEQLKQKQDVIENLKKSFMLGCKSPGDILVVPNNADREEYETIINACHTHTILREVEFSGKVAELEAKVERLECLLKERKENIESAQHWKEQAHNAEQKGWEKCKMAITTFFRMKAATMGNDQLSSICNAWADLIGEIKYDK